jgi:hypothetical protein
MQIYYEGVSLRLEKFYSIFCSFTANSREVNEGSIRKCEKYFFGYATLLTEIGVKGSPYFAYWQWIWLFYLFRWNFLSDFYGFSINDFRQFVCCGTGKLVLSYNNGFVSFRIQYEYYKLIFERDCDKIFGKVLNRFSNLLIIFQLY